MLDCCFRWKGLEITCDGEKQIHDNADIVVTVVTVVVVVVVVVTVVVAVAAVVVVVAVVVAIFVVVMMIDEMSVGVHRGFDYWRYFIGLIFPVIYTWSNHTFQPLNIITSHLHFHLIQIVTVVGRDTSTHLQISHYTSMQQQ